MKKIEIEIVYRFFSYLKFLWSSSNQHGVHSPFIYSYVTKCLYKKEKINLSTTERILTKSILYFNHQSIVILGDSKSTYNKIIKYCEALKLVTEDALLRYSDIKDFYVNTLEDNIHNDAVLILDKIHHNSSNTNTWETVKKHNNVTVTLDLFYCGVVFFRREQEKEHFKIRI